MIRREPSRIMLRLDDMDEFEEFKKEFERKKRAQQEVGLPSNSGSPVSSTLADTNMTSTDPLDPAARQERIHARIGFDPSPASSVPSRMGDTIIRWCTLCKDNIEGFPRHVCKLRTLKNYLQTLLQCCVRSNPCKKKAKPRKVLRE